MQTSRAGKEDYPSKLNGSPGQNNKILHWKLSDIPSRQKYFGLLTLLFGWGMHTNAKNKITYSNPK